MRGAAGGLAAAALLVAAPAAAATVPPASDPTADPDAASIVHAEPVDGAVRLVVSLPAGSDPDLGRVTATVGGAEVRAEAAPAGPGSQVERTSVLAIDTSLSMAGDRIAAAEAAALAYIDALPSDIRVGVVTFAGDAETVLEPTRDRAAAREAVTGLELRPDTALYDGVVSAVRAAGPESAGQRSVLVLSDGEDNTGTALAPTLRTVQRSGVLLDVVALQQSGPAATPLALLAQQGRGQVLDAADPGALGAVFEDEAQALVRQVVVTAAVPDDARSSGSADVSVSLPSPTGELSAAAYLPVTAGADPGAAASARTEARDEAATRARSEVAAPAAGGVSHLLGLIGVGAVGLGLLGALLALVSQRRKVTPEDRLRTQLLAYGVLGAPDAHRTATGAEAPSESLGDQARNAAQRALAGQAGLEAKIARRLEGAAARTTPAEWLLVHAGITVACVAVALLLGRGNPLLLLMALALGLVGPWVYLGFQRGRRLRAFGEALPDTLQLMSGSLSAGLSLAQSVDTIVREGTDPMATEFRRVVVESQLGVPFEDALSGVAERMDSKDFEWVVMAIRIQREVGGNLAELLLTVAATLREREYLRRHVRALSAEGRLSAWVLGGLPPAFMAFLVVTNPDYVTPLFTTGMGWVMLAGSALLMSVGVLWMVKAGKVEL